MDARGVERFGGHEVAGKKAILLLWHKVGLQQVFK